MLIIMDSFGIETAPGELEPVRGRIRIFVSDPELPSDIATNLMHGAWIRVETELKVPEGFYNPGCFNPRQYLLRQGIFYSGVVKYWEFLTIIKLPDKTSPVFWLHKIRRLLIDQLKKFSVPFFPEIFKASGVMPENMTGVS